MSDATTPAPSRRWFAIALGPLLFLAVELFFRPDLPPELVAEGASAVLVRHALAATLWIAAWWFTEALPIPATSLLPLALFPLLGLGDAKTVSRQYGHELVFLLLGGLLLAVAMERTGLHQRVALRIIRVFGSGRRALVLGFMVATATMSMWISNTATAVMLLPVALAVLSSVQGEDERGVDQAFPVALLLGIAFAANIGGLGTPIGSPPNLIFQSVYKAKTGVEVSFLEWMGYGVPLVAFLLPATWLYLVRGFERGREQQVELPRLGALTRDQLWVMVVFFCAAGLWITRGDFGELHGWGSRLARHGVDVKDSTVAIAASLVLFIAPAKEGGRILDWSVAPRLPWGVLILLGAGFAISSAFDVSGLTLWVGLQIEGFGRLAWNDTALLLALLSAVVAVSIVVTEFASNTASANILLPVLFGVSVALGPDRFPPDLLMISSALACTTGFAMPAGTPPNAIVFGTERISIGRFVRVGLIIDLFALLMIVAMMMVRRGLG
ncbi:MAG: SLC13/DASS family transporter [Planctomycetes bacterium]|nr:SLC13/DASS family transporter [Planctomycetota bacterium]